MLLRHGDLATLSSVVSPRTPRPRSRLPRVHILLADSLERHVPILPRHCNCNATCFSLFLDVGMAYILGALESPNSGAQKCIGKWLRENDSFKKYRTFCILFAIIGSFCFVLPHSCLQSICRTQCQLSDAFKKVKFGLRSKEIWSNLNIYVLQIVVHSGSRAELTGTNG